MNISKLFFLLALGMSVAANAAQMGRAFATPNEAASALQSATASANKTELGNIFGPSGAALENPDRVEATNELMAFTSAFDATNRLVRKSDTQYVLEVGTNFWPFPVPIVQQDGRWYFDTDAGKDELLNRRIGGNELAVLQVMRAYVDAQREYASQDRNGDQVLQYAQRIASTPGQKDGLYWPPEFDGEESPLGPLVADAQTKGYTPRVKGQSQSRAPFHGYYFKILTSQGKHAPGGKYNYIINGHMIGGFALVAWPAEYGSSGVMTFIVNQQGRVYQRDLGPKTSKIASSMTTYDPGSDWSVSPD